MNLFLYFFFYKFVDKFYMILIHILNNLYAYMNTICYQNNHNYCINMYIILFYICIFKILRITYKSFIFKIWLSYAIKI